jgi:hypothetical protein
MIIVDSPFQDMLEKATSHDELAELRKKVVRTLHLSYAISIFSFSGPAKMRYAEGRCKTKANSNLRLLCAERAKASSEDAHGGAGRVGGRAKSDLLLSRSDCKFLRTQFKLRRNSC